VAKANWMKAQGSTRIWPFLPPGFW